MTPNLHQIFAAVCFGLAVLHTFVAGKILAFSNRQIPGSPKRLIFHLLGEVEIVFAFWAMIFVAGYAALSGLHPALTYAFSRNFTEPAFVFVIMAIAATRPVLETAEKLIVAASRRLPFRPALSYYACALIIGPLLGSLITEPAAMTVTALLLKKNFYDRGISTSLMYATLGLLFVNISIGGTLTPFAAPPVLMVASTWNWDFAFMLTHFGWKAAMAVMIGTVGTAVIFRRELAKHSLPHSTSPSRKMPLWNQAAHLVFLAGTVITAHHPLLFTAIFAGFAAWVRATRKYQTPLRLKEALLVSLFLAGLVVLGGMQDWWIAPLIAQLDTASLFVGAGALTAITDNAALTYLGTLSPDLDAAARYALVAGAVTGGGLTVIANAPNPAGYGILGPSFGEEGVKPLRLLIAALPFTLLAGICFWFLGHSG